MLSSSMDIEELRAIWTFGLTEQKKTIQSSKAFAEFGLPLFDMTESKFLDVDVADVFSYGRPPVSGPAYP